MSLYDQNRPSYYMKPVFRKSVSEYTRDNSVVGMVIQRYLIYHIKSGEPYPFGS